MVEILELWEAGHFSRLFATRFTYLDGHIVQTGSCAINQKALFGSQSHRRCF